MCSCKHAHTLTRTRTRTRTRLRTTIECVALKHIFENNMRKPKLLLGIKSSVRWVYIHKFKTTQMVFDICHRKKNRGVHATMPGTV